MKAKKSFGQHFLTDENISERISKSLIHRDLYDAVLEVGPGKGMLTKYLLDQPYQFKAVEADKDMVTFLANHYPQLEVISKDFLKVDFKEIFDTPFGLIGNFPYNISSQIIFKMLDNKDMIPEMVGMFQKEMAERVVAPPGSKTYGVISVLTQAYYEGKYLFTVKPGSFNPPPKVQSAVIRLSRKENQALGVSYRRFRVVVKTAFGQRRKMMRNTLKGLAQDKSILEKPIFKMRPEQMSVQDFVELTLMLEG